MPSFLTAGWGSLEEHDSRLPCNASELFRFIINYAPYFFHRHKKEIGTEVSIAARFIIILLTKELLQVRAMVGSKHSSGQHQPAPGRAAGVSLWRHTRCTSGDFSCAQVRGAVSSKILPWVRGLHFAPTPKSTAEITPMLQGSASSPCLGLSEWISRIQHLPVLKWALCNGTDPRKLG